MKSDTVFFCLLKENMTKKVGVGQAYSKIILIGEHAVVVMMKLSCHFPTFFLKWRWL